MPNEDEPHDKTVAWQLDQPVLAGNNACSCALIRRLVKSWSYAARGTARERGRELVADGGDRHLAAEPVAVRVEVVRVTADHPDGKR